MEIALREYQYDLKQSMDHILKVRKLELQKYMVLLQHVSPEDVLQQKRLYLAECQDRMHGLMEKQLVETKHRLALYAEEMKGLSPLQKLQSGYTYTADEQGGHIDSVEQLQQGRHLTLTFADGQAGVTVDTINRQTNGG